VSPFAASAGDAAHQDAAGRQGVAVSTPFWWPHHARAVGAADQFADLVHDSGVPGNRGGRCGVQQTWTMKNVKRCAPKGLGPSDPAVIAAIDRVRRALSHFGLTSPANPQH
jgi:hypothetical protein